MKPNKEIIDEILNSNKTDIPVKGYYVYAIISKDENKILYIGKGKGSRVLHHFTKKTNQYLNFEIARLKSEDKQVSYTIIKEFQDQKQAYAYEEEMIYNCLLCDVDLLNIAKTDKDVMSKATLRHSYDILHSMLSTARGNCDQDDFSKSDAVNVLLDMIKEQLQLFPRFKKTYLIFGFEASAIKNIELFDSSFKLST